MKVLARLARLTPHSHMQTSPPHPRTHGHRPTLATRHTAACNIDTSPADPPLHAVYHSESVHGNAVGTFGQSQAVVDGPTHTGNTWEGLLKACRRNSPSPRPVRVGLAPQVHAVAPHNMRLRYFAAAHAGLRAGHSLCAPTHMSLFLTVRLHSTHATRGLKGSAGTHGKVGITSNSRGMDAVLQEALQTARFTGETYEESSSEVRRTSPLATSDSLRPTHTLTRRRCHTRARRTLHITPAARYTTTYAGNMSHTDVSLHAGCHSAHLKTPLTRSNSHRMSRTVQARFTLGSWNTRGVLSKVRREYPRTPCRTDTKLASPVDIATPVSAPQHAG